MKGIYLLGIALLSLFFLESCSKDKKFVQRTNTYLEGRWELRKRIGGMFTAAPDYKPGNGNTWEFTATTYKQTVSSMVPGGYESFSGHYTRGTGLEANTGEEKSYFLMDEVPAYKVYFDIVDDTLTLYKGLVIADGFIEKYVRD